MRAWIAVLGTLCGDARRRPGPTLAGVLATMVGVGVFVAIALSGQAARSSFTSAVDAVSGRATHEVTAPGGVDQGRLADLISVPGVAAAQPVIEGRAIVEGVVRGEAASNRISMPPLRILGLDAFRAIDFLADDPATPVLPPDVAESFLLHPATGLVSASWAEEGDLEAGDRLLVAVAGRRVEITLLGTWNAAVLEEGARDTLIVDVATGQELLARLGRLDRIELRFDPNADERAVEDRLAAILAPGERLGRPDRRGESLARMIDAFRLNLLALSGLALVVGALLVFGAAQFSVVRRGALLGQLRCLGTPSRRLWTAVSAETALTGAIGGALGLGLGHVLARAVVGPIGQTVTDLYGFVRIDLGRFSAGEAAAVVLGAMALAVAAGSLPALDAARTAPRFVGVRSRDEAAYRLRLPRFLGVSGSALVVATVAIVWPSDAWWPGLLGAFALLAAGAAILPPVLAAGLPWIRERTEQVGAILVPLAAGAVERSLSRAGSASGGLAVALAMMIGVLIMVGSFRVELDRWIESAIRADVFVADAAQRTTREEARIPPAVVDSLRGLPGLRGLDTLRSVEVPLADATVPLMGVEWALEESRRFEILDGEPSRAFDRAFAGELLASEPLARHHDLGVGDTVEVPTRAGVRNLRIVGIFRDYSSDRGLLVTGADPFLEMFGETGIRNVALWFDDDVDVDAVVADLRETSAARYALDVRSNRELRREVSTIFERTFAVTWVLQIIATGMALAGVAVTLNSLLLERRRELATLRALGMELGSLGRLFALEALLLVAFPAAVALPLGVVLAWILTAVINLRSFGWTIGLAVPWSSVAGTLALAIAAGLLATVLPLVLVRRLPLAAALREE